MSAKSGPQARVLSFRRVTLGDFAIASYLLAALSGVVLAVPFDAADAYGSLATIVLVNPAGVFFRNVHFWAGQAAFVLTLLHAWDHLRVGTERRVRLGVWARLVLALALIAFVMLSGFLLRGDADAQQALRILTEATTQIPLIGPALAAQPTMSRFDQLWYWSRITTRLRKALCSCALRNTWLPRRGARILMAQGRYSVLCLARYTQAMPPLPRNDSIV